MEVPAVLARGVLCSLGLLILLLPSLLPPRPRLLGVDKVLGYALNEWLQDIRKNQLPGLLGGVGPMHSVVQLCKCLALRSLDCHYSWATWKLAWGKEEEVARQWKWRQEGLRHI